MSVMRSLRALRDAFTCVSYSNWVLPDLSNLTDPSIEDSRTVAEFQPPIDPSNIEKVFKRFGITAKYKDFRISPMVTVFQVELAEGTRLAQVTRCEKDIARDLNVTSVRIVNLKGTSDIGLEVANTERITLYFKEVIKKLPLGMKLPMVMGEDTYGNIICKDLVDMPHLLVAGTTGSGKSVFINSVIATLISKKMPSEVKFLMIDPKRVEFVAYESIPHLMKPIAYDTEEARALLDVAVQEMEERFEKLQKARVKKLSEYNAQTNNKLPYIVFIVDEFSDLMMMGGTKQKKEVENKIVRIAQKARAVGIHMILATQKPIVQIMTSLIKANMPARVAFSVQSLFDSRVILDEKGAENLVGLGDMLFSDPTSINDCDRLKRIQAPFIPDADIKLITEER